eukprot:TRINITY_DN1281_c0_g1_i3.p1 TRINITY_DN1281_c0_g1~~TRINITY_DN1281_c0_g1_i3.p1  ORF type:complete len:176 (-),score=28.73 TRINITY_DN1281_c0_g1_i3:270-797(-)
MFDLERFVESLPPPRPWVEFFEADRFSAPKGADDLAERLEYNVNFYGSNYITLIVTILSLLLLSNPLVLIVVFSITFTGIYLFALRDPGKPLIINGQANRDQDVRIGFIVGSLLLMLITGGSRLVVWTGLSILLCMAHAACRKRNIANKATRVWNILTGRRTMTDTLVNEIEVSN